MKGRAFALITLALAGLWSRAYGQAALSFGSVGTNTHLDTNTRMLGWRFQVTQEVSVLSLGWFDWAGDGLSRAHEIGIWNEANSATPLASLTVPSGTAAGLDNHFRYVTLGSPLTLQGGNTYRIAGLDVGNGDGHVWDIFLGGYVGFEVVAFNNDPRIIRFSGGAFGGIEASFVYPTGFVPDGRSVLMGPNFTMAAVPEPATTTLLMTLSVAGVVMLARRRRPPRD